MISLSQPNISGNEWKYVKDCLDTGWISSVGSYVGLFEEKIASFTGIEHAIATVNGTAALHLSLQLAGVQQNDYVLTPNISFVATCNAVVYHKADPILIDVDRDTWQMDLELLENFLSTKTEVVDDGKQTRCVYKENGRVISVLMPVHVLGNMCDMDRLMSIANRYSIKVVEDSTEALGSQYRGRHAGTIGLIGTQSFNGNKIISTGGGGMILTNDRHLALRAKHLTTQAKIDPFEYMHDDIGYNYRLVNILAAVGVAQMEQLPKFLKRKNEIDHKYRTTLEGEKLRFQKISEHVLANNWLATMWVNEKEKMIRHLLDQGIQCRPIWKPMNHLPMFKKSIYVTNHDVANEVYQHCVSIPSSTNLLDEDVEKVIMATKQFLYQA